MLEHGAYTLLIDSCYDRERFPTLDEAYEWTWARSDEEKDAVLFVLRKFFVLIDNKYTQNRIAEELDKYHENSATNKRIAIEREERNRTNRARSVNEPTPNQEPLTNNHKPIKYIPPINGELLSDWLEVRKAKRAGKLTETAFKGLQREALLAGLSDEQAVKVCCERGWQSFKAEWLKPETKKLNGEWWSSNESMMTKGKEFGLSPKPGEAWNEFKGRIQQRIGS